MVDYKTTDEIIGPYILCTGAEGSPILVGEAKLTGGIFKAPHIKGTALLSYYHVLSGQNININTIYLKYWSVLTKEEADFWLKAIVKKTEEHDEASGSAAIIESMLNSKWKPK